MKKINIILAISTLALAGGCYQKTLLLEADAVSMTKLDAGFIKSLKPGEEVNEKWCFGDTPVYTDGDKNILGMADQVIYKAQDGGRKADFISNARIWTDSDGCAIITGKLSKM